MIDERDFTELDAAAVKALYNIRNLRNKRKDETIAHFDIVDFWDEVRRNKNKYKVWKREKDKIEFKIAKQNLRTAFYSEINRVLNTPWYDLPWYEKTIVGPFVLGLKGINWILRKLLRGG